MTEADVTAAFVANVARILEDRGWTQAELVRRLGKNKGNVSKALNGQSPPKAKTLAEYATALEVTVCELLCPVKPKRKK